MNREIEFRGKRCADGVWVYGDYVAGDSMDVSLIFPRDITSLFCVGGRYEVDENTVGQFTGLTDKHGEKIFEGDIIRFVDGLKTVNGEWVDNEIINTVEYSEGAFRGVSCLSKDLDAVEVIGNIYDNPELLNKK